MKLFKSNSDNRFSPKPHTVKSTRIPFYASLTLVVIFVALGVFDTQDTYRVVLSIRDFFATYFGWMYILAVTGFVVFMIVLLSSRYGSIRLGKSDEKPEFGYFSWFAMLFSCGMGIGLVFWSVAEPVQHLAHPLHSEPASAEAARDAMRLTFYHWGLHPWAVFSAMGVALAYFAYRHDLPLSMRSLFYPFLGDRIYGAIGHAVDVLAVFTTVIGIATSLGFGGIQVNSGLQHLNLMSVSVDNQLYVVGSLAVIATISVASGLRRGIRWLSNINLNLSILFVLFFIVFGPTRFLLNFFVQSVGYYLQELVRQSFWTASLAHKEWLKSWTLFYWAWWVSWAPFVSLFIARISRGRTVREFALGVLFVPAILSFIWLVLFGGTGIYMELERHIGLTQIVDKNMADAVYQVLSYMPFAAVTSLLLTLLISIYFITSCDSSVLVINTLLSQSQKPRSVFASIAWGLSMGAVAMVLLKVGGLTVLRSVSIAAAIPFLVVLIIGCYGLVIALEDDYQQLKQLGGT